MTFGRVNASARKMTSGCASLISSMSHSQNANGLVCGLSTRNMRIPREIQNSTMDFNSVHSARQSSLSKSNG